MNEFALEIGPRLALDVGAALAVTRLVYYRLYGNHDYVFAFFMLNLVTFFTCFVMRIVPVELGIGLGLFAVFGIVRYRTEPIRIRELTYLFVVIGMAIINALTTSKIGLFELATINGIILVAVLWLESRASSDRLSRQSVVYDNLSMLHPGQRDALVGDLSARTGLAVIRVDIDSIDLLRDTATLTVHYKA